MPIPILELYYF